MKTCPIPTSYFVGTGGCGGEFFPSYYMKQDLDTCRRSRCPRRGLQKAPASLGHTVPFQKPENLQLSLCATLLYLHWLLGLHFLGCQSQFPKLGSQEIQPGLPAAFFHSSLHFHLLLELNRIFTLAPTPAAAEKPYWNYSSSKRQAGLKGS